jgi:hypothetical protein
MDSVKKASSWPPPEAYDTITEADYENFRPPGFYPSTNDYAPWSNFDDITSTYNSAYNKAAGDFNPADANNHFSNTFDSSDSYKIATKETPPPPPPPPPQHPYNQPGTYGNFNYGNYGGPANPFSPASNSNGTYYNARSTNPPGGPPTLNLAHSSNSSNSEGSPRPSSAFTSSVTHNSARSSNLADGPPPPPPYRTTYYSPDSYNNPDSNNLPNGPPPPPSITFNKPYTYNIPNPNNIHDPPPPPPKSSFAQPYNSGDAGPDLQTGQLVSTMSNLSITCNNSAANIITVKPNSANHLPTLVAVFGKTGTGKTTFISSVAGLNLKAGHNLASGK